MATEAEWGFLGVACPHFIEDDDPRGIFFISLRDIRLACDNSETMQDSRLSGEDRF